MSSGSVGALTRSTLRARTAWPLIAYATDGPAGLGWFAVDADGAGPPREIDKPTYLGWRHPGTH
jgi:hypothetical protein